MYTQVLYSCFGKVNALVKVFGFAHAAKAQPYVCFFAIAIAIAVWRAVLEISMLDPEAFSV